LASITRIYFWLDIFTVVKQAVVLTEVNEDKVIECADIDSAPFTAPEMRRYGIRLAVIRSEFKRDPDAIGVGCGAGSPPNYDACRL